MTKFKNRKGLALGSIFALLISAFVGVAPAKAAAGDIIIEPMYGPSTNFTALAGAGGGIVLNTTYKTGVSATSGSLSYKVEVLTADLNAGDLTVTALSTLSATATTVSANTSTSVSVSSWSDATAANYNDILVLQQQTYSQVASQFNILQLNMHQSGGATTSFQVRITAWNDSIDNNKIDTGETILSEPVTVTFVHGAAVSTTVAVTQPLIGDSTISSTVTLGALNPENYIKLTTSPAVAIGTTQSTPAAPVKLGDGSSSSAVVTYDATTGTLTADIDVSNINLTGGNTLTAGTYYGFLHLNGDKDTSAASKFLFTGNSSLTSTSTTVAAATLKSISISAVTGTTLTQDTGLTGANTIVAKSGTKTLSFKFTGYKDAGTRSQAVGAGVVAQITVADVSGSLDETTITTPAGTTLASTGVNSRTFNVTSDINGEFSFDITADEGNDGEYFTIAAVAEGVSATTKTVKWQDEQINLFQGPTPTSMKIANGGSISVDYFVRNQWGQVPAGDYQVEVTRARASGLRTVAAGTVADWSYEYPVEADGTVTVTITDNGSATVEGADTVTVQLQKKATAGGAFVDVATDGTEARSFTLTYETDLSAATLETTANNNGAKRGTTTVKALALEAEALRNFDSRVDSTDALEFAAYNAYTSATATTATELVAISGYVKTAAGVGITGVPVVISGSGLMFSDGASGTSTAVRHSLDSMILTTGTGGAYTFYVRGNLSGTKTVTVAAAGKSNNVSLTFAAGSTAAANMAITAPATSDAGKVIDVVVKVTDAFGNPASGVDVTFKSKGAGYLNALSGTSDADGEVIVKLITLTNDSGTATITATATLAGVSTAKVATVTVGAAAASADQKVNAGSFKGYVALYAKGYAGQRMSAKVGNDWVVVESLASNFERVVEFTGAGYTISVPIYIDRVLVDTIVVTTK